MAANKQKILIVDDTPQNIEVLAEVLGPDQEILFAVSGRDGLDIALSEAPDLILLDVMMPEMDGYEVCTRLKAEERTKDIPVIFITALNQEDDEAKGLEIGAIDYITKPISPPIVRARVKNHLELKRYRDFLENLSSLDGLTGVPNRRRFDECLDLEWRRALRSGGPFALIMMDIDFFKAFNDNYGHVLGDDCLKRVAAALATVARRPGDMVARYGGEEFVCLLPETNIEGAVQVADSLREKVISQGIPHRFSSVAGHVTMSFGVAVMIPSLNKSPTDLIKLADERLYQAKQTGRNRIIS
ncbi:MAG: PleD family two-component system response regulator [Deltaproteobacteria bacterium]|nr:PleD family two-component system response regulator [Deltaproteobacteria bacterium]